jgi:hypothetical protein
MKTDNVDNYLKIPRITSQHKVLDSRQIYAFFFLKLV